ncbi:hypothetical protein PEBR_43189 [Penicillium brasilianum]|uniref:Uncharacterized protein n=1 Tax=Penicillium brasilianum TaxID=104259 RepID=A0A1S9R8D6_PENBI|nr:hypothetical protein PEBR_43189 [Penicillium brasilianum]
MSMADEARVRRTQILKTKKTMAFDEIKTAFRRRDFECVAGRRESWVGWEERWRWDDCGTARFLRFPKNLKLRKKLPGASLHPLQFRTQRPTMAEASGYYVQTTIS